MKRVLFLCTGNSARSQMAEGWAKHLGAGITEVYSAGTRPASNVNPFAIAVMNEQGIDISLHKTKSLADIDHRIDLIVAVCAQAAEECPVPPGGVQVERWNLSDPASAQGTDIQILEAFRKSRDEIESRVRDFLSRLQ